MNLGNKSSLITSSLGVKKSVPSLSLGVKQSHNPQMDSSNLVKNYTSDGMINNHSNSNHSRRDPIKGISLPHTKVNHTRNHLEKASKIRHEKYRNHFA